MVALRNGKNSSEFDFINQPAERYTDPKFIISSMRCIIKKLKTAKGQENKRYRMLCVYHMMCLIVQADKQIFRAYPKLKRTVLLRIHVLLKQVKDDTSCTDMHTITRQALLKALSHIVQC
jgi:hypothetical protein